MAFTKVVGAGIHTLSNITSHNINSSGIITATKFVGPFDGTSGTFSGNVTIDGNLSVAQTVTYEDVKNVDSVGVGTFREGIFLPDNKQAKFGNTAASPDLKLYSDGTNGILYSQNNPLYLKGDAVFIQTHNNEAAGYFFKNGGVKLYYDGSALPKFETTSSGVSIGGTTIITSASGGKLGIGTDNPSGKLDIVTGALGGNVLIDAESSSGYHAKIVNDSGDLTLGSRNTSADTKLTSKRDVIILTGSSEVEKLRIKSDGKVGIGTDPTKDLHVDGTIFASGATTSLDGGLRIQPNNNGTNYGGAIYGGAHNDNNTAIYMRRGADGGNNTIDMNSYGMFRVFTDGALASQTERLRIGSNGSVGIGTDYLSGNASVYHKLMVEGDTTSQIAVAKILRRNSSASNSTYTFEVDSSAHTSNMANGGAMSVDVNSGRAFTIDGNGKVGINTTLPTKKLQINTTGTSGEGILLKATDSTYPSFIGDANRSATDLFLVALQGYWNGNRVGEVTVESGSDTTNKDEGMVKIRTRNAGDSSPQDRLTVYHTGQTQVHSTTDSSSTTTGSLVVSGGIGVAKNIICGGYVGINETSPIHSLSIGIDTATAWAANKNISNTTNNDFIGLNLTNKNTGANPEIGIMFQAGVSGSGQYTINSRRSGTNTADLIFRTRDGGGDSKETLRIDSDGRLIVGGGTHAGGSALVVKGGNQNTYSTIGMFSNHTNPSDDTLLSQIRFGSNTSAVGADLRIYADDDWGNNDYPSRMEFYTAPNGSNDRKKRLAINSTGNIGINCGKTTLEGGVDIGTSDLSANTNTPLIIGTEGGMNRFLKVNFFGGQQNFHSLTLRCNDNGIMNQLDISNPFGGAGYGSGIRFTGYNNDIGGKIEMINHAADNASSMYMRFKSGGDNERMRIDQNGKVIVASGTLHSTRVLARFGIDCHGMDIYDGVGVVANYGMAFYNDPNTNKANGIGFFNDDGQTCGGYIVHQDKGSSNLGDLIFATAATANAPVERLRIESDGNIKQNLTSPSGTSPFQDSHWYDRAGGHYTLSTTDHDSFTAVRTSSGGEYNNIIYKRVRMSKNCDIEFELSGNSPAGIYRHVGFVINGDGTETHSNWDRLVFRSRPANTGSNQIRIDKGGGGYGFNVESSSIPTFFDGTERHILIQLRDRLVNVIVDGEVIISQKTNADFNRSQGWFGFSIYEGGESAQITIRNLTIKNKFIQPHWLVRATGVNIDVSNGDPLPFNQVIKSSSDMSNTSHYNNSSYRFTAPISGMYYCFVRAYRNSSNGSEVAFYVNGSVRNRFKPVPNGGDYIFAGSCLIQLMKGEYIDVRAYSANFGNFYGNSNQSFSSWGGHLID